MSLEHLSQVTERLNMEDGILKVFPGRKNYAKEVWKNCDRKIQSLWHKLDSEKQNVFLREYFGHDAEETFHQSITFLDWVYAKLNKSLFDSECAIYIASPQQADEIWVEYALNRGFDVLWLCSRALPTQAVMTLEKLSKSTY